MSLSYRSTKVSNKSKETKFKLSKSKDSQSMELGEPGDLYWKLGMEVPNENNVDKPKLIEVELSCEILDE